MSLFNILDSIYTAVLLSVLLIGIYNFRHLRKPLQFIFMFVVFGCLTEISMEVLKAFGMRNTSPVGNVYFPVAFLILGLFYFHLLKDYINKKLLIGIIAGFVVLALLNLFFTQDLNAFPNIIAPIGSLIIIVFSLVYFSKVMSEAKIRNLSAEPSIWINTDLLIYYSVNLFYFSLFNLSWDINREFTQKIHLVYVGVTILLYALIAVGFWKARKQKQ